MSTTQPTTFTVRRLSTKIYEHSDIGYIPLITSTITNVVTTTTTTPVSLTSPSNGHMLLHIS